MLGQCYSEFNGCKFDIEGQDHLHLRVDQVLTRPDNVKSGVNPDDPRCTSQGECSPEPPSYASSTVMMKDLQVNSTAREAQDHKNLSFEFNITLESQDGS